LLLRRFDENRLTSLWGLVRHPWRTSYFLCFARESNQREARSPVKPATARGRCGGSLTGHPWPDSERARLVRAPLRAFSFAPSPRPRGTREPKKRSRSTKKENQKQPARRPRESGDPAPWLLLRSSLSIPLCRGEGRTEKPRAPHAGGARDRADSIVRPGWPVDRTRPPVANRPLCGRRGTEGALSFATFSGRAEKVARRPGWPARPTRT
jgi:hypothetical protein